MDIFNECIHINELIECKRITDARTNIIKLLDRMQRENIQHTPLVNHLIRKVGLFQYIDSDTASWEDRIVAEVFKADVGTEEPVILHSAQSRVLKHLLLGDNIAVSAPTSFGKSFIIDAFIAIRKPENVVIIVPTIALADETRRRLEHKFSRFYKIITTTDASVSERNIFIFPQERSFAYLDKLNSIDILIVDEFYKASSMFEDQNDRSSALLSAMIELGKISQQRYYLAPNIHYIADNVFTRGMQFIQLVDFNTVITESHKIYENKNKNEDSKQFKQKHLLDILKNTQSKTLVYAGSYNNINHISHILIENLPNRESTLLNEFNDWLQTYYGHSFSICHLCKRGIGVHNGKMHRALSQLQVKLFEEQDGIDTIISTSSIIEGVNTQAEQVIVWSNRNGAHKFNYFTYRNIIGRAGRMFKYFIGKVYLLDSPPKEEDTTLEIEFPKNVVDSLDANNPGIELNQNQLDSIKEHAASMEHLLGTGNFENIRKLPAVKSFDSRLLRILAQKLKSEPNWPTGYSGLTSWNSYDWREPIFDITNFLKNNTTRDVNVGHIKIAIWKLPDNWERSYAEIIADLSNDNYTVTPEDLFAAERFISYKLCSVLNVINILKKNIYPNSPDISPFITKASNAFLPKLVYQLEEYGMPRMISRKIHESKLINLENNQTELSEIINKFKEIGQEALIKKLNSNILPFDKYVIKYFYEGIS